VELHRSQRAREVLHRAVLLPGLGIVEDEVALAEGPALGVLAGQADRDPLGQQRGEGQRLGRLEQGMEATAIEIERIGEGQRFLTRLFTEGTPARALGPSPAELVERKPGDAGQAIR